MRRDPVLGPWLAATLLVGAMSTGPRTPATAAEGGDTAPASSPARGSSEDVFLERVRPLLKEKCLGCHGDDPKKVRGGLDLGSLEATLRGGESGEPAVVPGRPDDSPLYLAVTRPGDAPAMPPKENDRLAVEDVEAIRSWIAGGAPWPAGRPSKRPASPAWGAGYGVTVATSGGLSPEWTGRKYKPEDLWAYRPLRRPALPAARGPASNPIDAFLSEALDRLGLAPAPEADRRTLIRRATFDLTGLPPSPGEVEAFAADPDPDDAAFARVVDRLLASPHYGEQYARQWLDVTRYADSSGFANDYARGNAWRYRDYVVRSFNADKPYDRFVREQLAGDEIDPGDPEMLVAAGFLRMGPWELTGMEVARVARQRFLDDVTDAVGQVFLGHTLQCARCHDHKFDPVPTRDYYAIQAVFATTQLSEREAPFVPSENTAGFEERRYLEARRARCNEALAGIRAKQEAAARAWCAERGLPYVPRARGLKQGIPEDRLAPREVGLAPRDFGMERIGRKGLERLVWELDAFKPVALSVYSGRTPQVRAVTSPSRMPADRLTAGDLEASHILTGGDPYSPGDSVRPGVLSAVAGLAGPDASAGAAGGPAAIPGGVEGRRRALADWVVDPGNPLAPRVMVNRLWQWHFGRAIAGNPNNFGATGKKPAHPELLDWLASEFVDRGWSVKAMHRLIMTSRAYRRSSRHPDPAAVAAKDPDGVALAAFRPRRLAAEELRDALLAASGELNPAVGGIPVRPALDPEVALQPRAVMGTFAPAWQASPSPSQRHRRSLYALKLRGLRDPFLEVFNQPSPETPCEGRDASTVTPQVFSLFNGEDVRARSLALAARLLRESGNRREAVDRAFRLTLGRPPAEDESRACLEHWASMAARHRVLRFERPALPREVVREAVEENTGETFTFTEVLDGADDFVPDLHPADVDAETRGLMEVCLVLFNTNEFAYID